MTSDASLESSPYCGELLCEQAASGRIDLLHLELNKELYTSKYNYVVLFHWTQMYTIHVFLLDANKPLHPLYLLVRQ